MPDPAPLDPPPPVALADPAIRHNARVGLWLFGLYFLLYAGFVGITVVDYRVMARPVVGGVNLAVCYGMFLIVAAIVLAVVYSMLCRAEATPDPVPPTDLPPTGRA